MQRDCKVYFEDILNAISNMKEYTQNLGFEEFKKISWDLTLPYPS